MVMLVDQLSQQGWFLWPLAGSRVTGGDKLNAPGNQLV